MFAAPSPSPVSTARLRANRRNARKSTGPRTVEGKARSARNATSHGLFCRDLVLPGEDGDLFRLLRASVIERLRPQDIVELSLVDRYVEACWKLKRCQHAEKLLHAAKAMDVQDHMRRRIARLDERHGLSEMLDHADEMDDTDEMNGSDTNDASDTGDGNDSSDCVDTAARNGTARDGVAPDDVTSDDPDLRRLMQRFHDLTESAQMELPAAATLTMVLQNPQDLSFDRLARHQRQFERSMDRALRELSFLRDKLDDCITLPQSPYAEDLDALLETPAEPDAKSAPAPPPAEPSPGIASDCKRQNEPTARSSPASPGPASTCAPRRRPLASAAEAPAREAPAPFPVAGTGRGGG